MTPWHHLGKCSDTLDDLGMPLQLLVLQALQLTPSAPVMSKYSRSYGLWLHDKKATVFQGNRVAHRIAVEWSTWSGCIMWRMLQNKMMQNLRTCFNWFILIKQQRKPGLWFLWSSFIFFHRSRGSLGNLFVFLRFFFLCCFRMRVGMHAFHRNQTVLNISKNALKISKAGISKEPTWTNSDISMHGQTLTVLGTCSGNFLCLYCYLVCQVPAACAMRHSIDHFKIFQTT